MSTTSIVNTDIPVMSTTHPFVGLEASGEHYDPQSLDTDKWAMVAGPVVAFNGKSATILLNDGRLVEIHRVTMADPDAARAALLSAKK